jgi:hypothetical protein
MLSTTSLKDGLAPSWLHEELPQLETPKTDIHGGVQVMSPVSPIVSGDAPTWLTEDMPLQNTNISKIDRRAKNTQKSLIHLKTSSKEIQHSDGWCCPGDPVLYWCRILHFFASISIVFDMVINGYLITFVDELSWRSMVLHSYGIIFCIVSLGVEMGLPFVVDKVVILNSWFCRGMFYFFLGVLTCEIFDSSLVFMLVIIVMTTLLR